ncbi:three-Cys-motif partner protein TcmP [Streptomyces flavofungini]|uniref:three-Cys-motif partner protein TcmP n=1 Tax=Streptomyces flavofungini TaxID=68200 RepID=UPI0034DFC617
MDEPDEAFEDVVLDLAGERAGEKDTDSTSPFFVSKKAAAVLKHEILNQYVVPFVSKVGQWAPDKRVVYMDGYAGPGRYEDGTPGSPALVLSSATAVAQYRRLDSFFIEQRRPDYERLSALVEEANQNGTTATALHGKVEDHLDHVLGQAAGAPLLAFIDPFGIGLSFESLTQKVFGSRPGRGATGRDATEVLLNFNANAVRRIGGYLRSTKVFPAKEAGLAALDTACGGDWWRHEHQASQDNREAVRRIAREFAKRVGNAVGAYSWAIPVHNRAENQPVYYLIFISRHKGAVWLFGEALSIAQEKWRRACQPLPAKGTLFGPEYLSNLFEEEEKKREKQWIATIKDNVHQLLQKRSSFTVDECHLEVMQGTLGVARQKHIRAAIKELHKEGKTGCAGKGKIPTLRITSP